MSKPNLLLHEKVSKLSFDHVTKHGPQNQTFQLNTSANLKQGELLCTPINSKF